MMQSNPQPCSQLRPTAKRMNSFASTALCFATAGLLLATSTTSCSGGGSGGGGDNNFVLRNTSQSVDPNSPLEIVGRWLLYLADEATTGATGTDFNGDTDTIDSIAVVVNTTARVQNNLMVAAEAGHIIGDEVYLVVDEQLDGRDWDGVVADNTVLLHWTNATKTLTFVDVLSTTGAGVVATANNRLYYTSADPSGVTAPDTLLRYVGLGAPMTPMAVQDGATGISAPDLIGEDEGLLFCTADENVEGTDLNGDGDSTDTHVLCLLNSENPAAPIKNTGIAVVDETVAFRARSSGAGEWLVAFLADEAAKSDFGAFVGGYNDPGNFAGSWQPPQCSGSADTDQMDQVLHYLDFAPWVANPGANPIVNTGLVGDTRVFCAVGSGPHVGTLSSEADEGGCDLNGDGDSTDRIVRWIEATGSVGFVFTSATQLVAVASTNGGDEGVSELENSFVAVIDEAADGRDYDGDPGVDNELVAWLDPATGAAALWTVDHDDLAPMVFVGTNWARSNGERTTYVCTQEESVFGSDINGDGDMLDAVPTFADFDANGMDMDFPGVAVAAESGNAGIAIAKSWAFYRVDEAEDLLDWNGDGDMTDRITLRTGLVSGATQNMGVSSDLARDAVEFAEDVSGASTGAFIVNEAFQQIDYNKDGDTNDLVVRYFRF